MRGILIPQNCHEKFPVIIPTLNSLVFLLIRGWSHHKAMQTHNDNRGFAKSHHIHQEARACTRGEAADARQWCPQSCHTAMSVCTLWEPCTSMATKTKVNRSEKFRAYFRRLSIRRLCLDFSIYNSFCTYTASRIASTTPATCWPPMPMPFNTREAITTPTVLK